MLPQLCICGIVFITSVVQGSQTRQHILHEPTSKPSNQENCLEDNKQNDNEIIEGSMHRTVWTECFLHSSQQLQK
jgi:hypothetical protein